jgi:hypothetical protein
MEAVIDSVSINDLLRKPKFVRHKGARMETSLDIHIKSGRFQVAMDREHAIIDEWCRSCGDEHVQVLVTRWTDMAGFRSVDVPGIIPSAIIKRLKALGFKDRTIDKLLLRTAMGSAGHRLISRDPDFWDPDDRNKHPVGDPAGAVVMLCRRELNITVSTLSEVIATLGQFKG